MINDLISRKEAIDLIRSLTVYLSGRSIFHPEAKNSVISNLESLPAVDAVLCDEYEATVNRLQHLLQSDFIASFDKHDRKTHTYARDIAEADAVTRWISIKDARKPKHLEQVLCRYKFTGLGECFVNVLIYYAYGNNGYVNGPHFSNEGMCGMYVTHWMPLPVPPKEEA